MEKLILSNYQAPGDIVMLTAAVRDLHRTYPGRFLTDVRTPFPELWENNPHLTPLDETDPTTRVVECHYPLIERSNQAGCHFIHGFMEDLDQQLGLAVRPSELKGDIHLAAHERDRNSALAALDLDPDQRFWIIVAGGKYDFTIKWWSHPRFQEVVDELADEIHFVQVGRTRHEYHPPLRGVTDLRDKTSLRELVRLVHHADGVLCPVTSLMHLAAAVPVPQGGAPSRPCVVVAGGREAPHWEAYPNHQFIHNVGALPCCATGGCWRSRTVPLGDGHALDAAHALCVDVTAGGLARCMELISAEDVARRVRIYRQLQLTPGGAATTTHTQPENPCQTTTR